MKRLIIIGSAAMMMVWTPQAATQHHETKPAATSTAALADTSSYVCPMHPKVTSSKPGACSKCGMALVKQKLKVMGKAARDSLKAATKDELIEAGKYNCCTKQPCDECYKGHQSCNCYRSVKTNKKVCMECGNRWKDGDGRVPGVNPDSIKSESHGH